MKKSTKNTLDLDIKITGSRMLILLSLAVIIVVLCLCAAVGLSMWQWLIMAVVASVVLMHIFWRQKHQVCHISADEIEGIWLIKADKPSAAVSVQQSSPRPYLPRTHRSTLSLQSAYSLKKHPYSIIHQGYLHDIQAVDLGITQAVVLDFYVILPKKQRLRVVLFQDQLTAQDFSRLMALARLT